MTTSIRSRLPAALAVLMIATAACGGSAGTTTTAAGTTSSAAETTVTSAPETTTTTEIAPTGPRRGFAISPPEFTQEGFEVFLGHLEEGATLLEWVGDGFEWDDEQGGPNVGMALAAEVGVELITIGGWAHTEDGSLVRPLTAENVAAYVDAARAFAAAHQPDLMGFGVEMNTHWLEFPEHWEDSTALFAAVADAVHDASPGTQVFIVFQLERMRGLNGGLFGGENSEDAAHWELIDDFPDADIIGFTTYPSLVFTDPSEVPDDYYTVIREHTDKPVVFTEMGWHAGGDFAQWSGTPEKQADFVRRIPELFEEIDPVFYTWAFLFDQQIPGIWESIGFFTTDGDARPAWDVWVSQ